jgi:cold-inducible RNA-binding protein
VLADADPAVRVRIGTDRMTGKPRGFAFAEFSDPARAADAIRRFDAFELRGRRLRVNDADDKPPARGPRPMAGPRPMGTAPTPSFGRGDFGLADPGYGGFNPGGDDNPFRRKGGSRRGIRAKKRSLR